VRRFRRQCRQRQPAEYAQAVIHGNEYDAVGGEVPAVVVGFRGAAVDVSTAVDPYDDGCLAGAARRPDIQEEAILAEVRDAVVVDAPGRPRRLNAAGAKAARVTHALPAGGRDGRRPAPLADGRLRIGDSFEGTHTAGLHSSGEHALRSGDDRATCG